MSIPQLKHILGLVALFLALATYTLCVQPTVPFWDCAEFTAAAVQQQVPHPPGAPLFLMVGKLFHLIPIGDPAVRVNMVSVVASALTIWLCYYIAIMMILNIAKRTIDGFGDALVVYGAALVGSLAFCWSDTFWFNAVESEVYASSSLFVALIVYLMLRWHERADESGHERYLLLIAYLIGLSTGVHLLSVLCIFSIGLLVYFRKYSISVKNVVLTGALTLFVFIIVYPGVVKYYPALLAGNLPWQNEAHEYHVENELWVQVLGWTVLVASVLGVYIGMQKKKSLVALASASFVCMFCGYTTYTQILIRSNANPPMNENAPKTFRSLISYLGREQYGDAPMFPRRFERDADKIEAYKKYGPYTPPPYKSIESLRSPGMSFSVPDYAAAKSNSGDWNYLFSYQLDHMFFRYLLWNFFGRSSDVQDAEAWTWTSSAKYLEGTNFGNGYASHFPIAFYGLPFVLGLLGMVQHFRRDYKMAIVFAVMFLMMGLIAAFAQNQQEPQPRERDYFYTGAFMVWALWIAVGSMSVVDIIRQKVRSNLVTLLAIVLCLTLVPLNMAAQGWFIHSRANNYVPFDYAYNILQSCEEDAILVTNGDNDTFPLWLLQDVYGVRRDIRIVNMSLASTLWYVYDLKNLAPWGAKPIPLSFSDQSLLADEYSAGALSTKVAKAEHVQFELSDEVCKKYALNKDSTSQRRFEWEYTGYARENSQYAFTVSQQVIGEIVKRTQFKRPLYYSITCGYPTAELYCGLGSRCRLEGMAYRVCPQPVGEPGEVIDANVMEKCLMHLKYGDSYSTGFDYGFKFRNLNNAQVYYDETHRHYIDNYRTLFIRYANLLSAASKNQECIAVLDSMNAIISLDLFPMSYALMQDVSDLYAHCGANKQASDLAKRVAEQCELMVNKTHLQKRYAQFVERMPPALSASQAYTTCKQFDKARAMLSAYRDQTRDEAGYELRMAKLNADEKESIQKYDEAVQILRSYVLKMKSTQNPQYNEAIAAFEAKAAEIELKIKPQKVAQTTP